MSDYALVHSDDETRRLIRQAQYLAPHMRRTLEAAGVKAGTRVLDLGAGMGDVSMIAAELGAQVVAVERDPATVERARALPGPALARQSMATMCKIFDTLGCATDLGLRLPQVIAAAGLPTPSLDVIMWTGVRDDDVGYEMVPGVLRSLTPLAERVGLAGEIDPDLATLAHRLRAATHDEGTFVGPIVCGAATRR